MKINWKVRFKNKTWLTAFICFIISIIYKFFEMFDVIPVITQDAIIDAAMMVLQFLGLMGIIIDPTTNNGFMGLSDSERALSYKEPRKDEINEEPNVVG